MLIRCRGVVDVLVEGEGAFAEGVCAQGQRRYDCQGHVLPS